ncbi:N-acetyltransferase [Lentilactobacillus fungorum]|uniref:N-acetyltransferase n=1 Tax=Lentilactobacillus fungorum TaxID=2201250 RepID=A0ABQ3VWJ4_9LACO|nr:GNAT family N-acetyltransferase [Lentilactobacillus fungorum]GHP12816.1 N-acetyltransferase [Lentilactobacillus fungorum]
MIKKANELVGIRKMTVTDYPDAYALWKVTPGMNLREFDDSFKEISRLIQFNPDFCFVAEQNHQLIGTILGATDGRRGRIYHLAVAKTAQRQGIGTKLVNLVIERLREVGISKISATVMKHNHAGAAFWQKLKFSERLEIETFTKII